MSILSHNLKEKGFLTLREHLDQIRAAVSAIRARHSRRLLEECAEAWAWLEDCIRLHDTGKGSAQFQQYIRDPDDYVSKNLRDTKSHTPLSTVIALALARGEKWDTRRTFAIAQIANGHHGALETHDELTCGLYGSESVLDRQVPGIRWDHLADAVGWDLSPLVGIAAEELLTQACDDLGALFDTIAATGDVRYRLLCQLAFSVLLEADKAFLAVAEPDRPAYLTPRRPHLDPEAVPRFLACKPSTNVNPLRDAARRHLLAGLDCPAPVQTLTLPTGLGKTMLAATWALHHRAGRPANDPPPLVLIVLPFLSIIDQTTTEYQTLFADAGLDQGDLISYHSLSDRTYAADLEAKSQDFFLDTWHSSLILTTFDQFCQALLSPQARHQMRFHHLTNAVIVLDEVQTLPPRLWLPLQAALSELPQLGTTRVLAMTATQPGFLPNATELIPHPQSIFAQMGRYRLVFRHGELRRLSHFVAECLGRLEDWRGRKVLLTFNTRRSARIVRDALAKRHPKVYFITADVTPADRLSTIQAIKAANSECLVVSTQCIEAGVDIDMDFVIRDFGPLDSIIQVAGRCNRNGQSARGTVEIVSLCADDNQNPFAEYIYDCIQLHATRDILSGRSEVLEEEVFTLSQAYFARLWQNETGATTLRDWQAWRAVDPVRTLLRGKQPRQVAFVVIERDSELETALNAAVALPDRWDRRRAIRRLAARVARLTVSVYLRPNLDPSRYARPFPPTATAEDAWFWLLNPGRHTPERGLDLGNDTDDQEGWMVIV